MITEILKELEEQTNIRANLISLKEQLTSEDCKDQVLQWEEQTGFLRSFLTHEDPKVRKNAALILGAVEDESALDELFTAYEKEDKLFVKSSYLSAMQTFDCAKYSDQLHERYEKLCKGEWSEEESKHILAEQKAMEKLIQKLDGVIRHKFAGWKEDSEVILTTNAGYRDVTADRIHSADPVLIPAGVKVKGADIRELIEIRTYREMLFMTNASRHIPDDPDKIANELIASGILEQIESLHEGEPPYYFRIEKKKKLPTEKTGEFIHHLANCLEKKSGRKLINSTDNYESEIRLNRNKNGTIFPCLKLYTIPMKRFAYRKHSIAASIHPATAALLMELAKPYLKPDAQVIDTFCGVGTMLVERNMLVPAGDMYGTDIFGEAITGARENAEAADMMINYIQRNFFDFTHDYLFDEIVTNMPARGKKSKEEQDRLYSRFFEKAAEILKPGAVVVMYSNEMGFIKKQLRLNRDFVMKKEFCIRAKEGYCLFIIGYKG